MDWKEFFKPAISKAIIFALLLLIFGVPAFVKQCATFDFGIEKFPCGPTRFAFHNPLIKSQIYDAVDIYSYNIFLVAFYLTILYVLLSLIYFYTRKNKVQRIVYLISFVILFIITVIWISIAK